MADSERIEILQLSAGHNKSGFDCGNEDLNRFLKRLANQNAKKGLSVTYVADRPGETAVLGFYCISTGHVACSNLPDSESRKLPSYPIPVVRIGRLATGQEYRGHGIGKLLLVDVLKNALRVSKEMGVFAVEVDAKSEDAKSFYLKYGFAELNDNELHLYLSIKTIKKLFRAT